MRLHNVFVAAAPKHVSALSLPGYVRRMHMLCCFSVSQFRSPCLCKGPEPIDWLGAVGGGLTLGISLCLALFALGVALDGWSSRKMFAETKSQEGRKRQRSEARATLGSAQGGRTLMATVKAVKTLESVTAQRKKKSDSASAAGSMQREIDTTKLATMDKASSRLHDTSKHMTAHAAAHSATSSALSSSSTNKKAIPSGRGGVPPTLGVAAPALLIVDLLTSIWLLQALWQGGEWAYLLFSLGPIALSFGGLLCLCVDAAQQRQRCAGASLDLTKPARRFWAAVGGALCGAPTSNDKGALVSAKLTRCQAVFYV